MSDRVLNCPACGAPLNIESRFTTIVVCEYCGQTSFVHDEGLDPTGKVAKITDYHSRLRVGDGGTVRGRRFEVLGRVRFSYEEGQWDEWFLRFDDGEPVWLSEDEGEYVLYSKRRLTQPVPPWEEIRVGGFLPIPPLNVFITDKRATEIAGAEGEISSSAGPGETFHHVHGNAAGRAVGVIYTRRGIDFTQGDPLEFHEIQVSPPPQTNA
jgi:hypothetical protein